MNKYIICVFNSEQEALAGLGALHGLHGEGSITLYSNIVLAKNPEGEIVTVQQQDEKGPIGTAVGMGLGGLVGLLAGPLAGGAVAASTAALGGAVIGTSLGGMTGMAFDLHDAAVDLGLVEEVSEALAPGKVAVVAEIEEFWMVAVDNRIEALGGIIFRRWRSEVADEQYLREAEAFNEELDQLGADFQAANEETKASIQGAINKNRLKLEALNESAEARLRNSQKEMDVRIAVLRDQAETASEERKAKIEARIEATKAEYAERNAKLEQARQLTREALSSKQKAA